MLEGCNGQIKIGDKWIDAKIEMNVSPEIKEEADRMFDWRNDVSKIEGKIEGKFIAGDGLDAFIQSVYAAKNAIWRLQYLAQGKIYPIPRIRKSEKWRARMCKKMGIEYHHKKWIKQKIGDSNPIPAKWDGYLAHDVYIMKEGKA